MGKLNEIYFRYLGWLDAELLGNVVLFIIVVGTLVYAGSVL